MINNKFCLFDKNLDIDIYHFTSKNLSKTNNITYPATGKKINYNQISSSDGIKNIFNKAIKMCKDRNILIIINSILLDDIAQNINNYLENNISQNDVSLQNITIINYTNDNRKVIYLVKDIFRKIINVFSLKDDQFTNDKDFFTNIQLNKNIPKTVDPDSTVLYTFKQKGGNIREIMIRIMDATSSSDKLEEQWWFSWYFNIPPCANIRLLQSTGTCWANASINSLFLIKEISEIIQERYTELSEDEQNNANVNPNYKIKLKDFGNSDYSLEEKLFSLVYHLLVNKTKAKYSDGNFVGYLATHLKCQYENKPKKCHDIQYGDSGSSALAIKTMTQYLFNKDDYIFVDLKEILINGYENLVKKFKKKIKTQDKYINRYNEEIKKVNIDQRGIDTLKNKIEGLDIALKKMNRKIETNGKQLKNLDFGDFNIDDNKMFSKYKPNKILIFAGEFDRNIKKNIIFADQKYQLLSSTIGVKANDFHLISGIICNNKSYVYDSNNILVETDWENGEKGLEKYFNNRNVKEMYKKINFVYIECLVYILSNTNDDLP